MADAPRNEAVRTGMQPENVAVLVIAALVVGLVLGQAVGRRQGLTIKQVALPPEAAHGAMGAPGGHLGSGGMGMAGTPTEADDDAAMKATAPRAPQSVAEARKMVDLMPNPDAEALVDLGNRKLKNHVTYLAIGFFQKALELKPDQPEVWASLAAGFHQVRQDAEAQQAADEALKRDPKLAEAWYLRGLACQGLKQPDEARKAFNQYLQLSPAGPNAAAAKEALKAVS